MCIRPLPNYHNLKIRRNSPYYISNRSWIDFFLSVLLYLGLLPFQKLGYKNDDDKNDDSNNKKDQKKKKYVDLVKIRESIVGMSENEYKKICSKWKQSSGSDKIVEVKYTMPQRNILHDWGVIGSNNKNKYNDDNNDENDYSGVVDVYLYFPSSVYEDKVIKAVASGKKDADNKSYVVLDEKDFNIHKLNADVPLVLWFHGGGLVAGSAKRNIEGLQLANKLSELSSAVATANDSKGQQVVIASVNYRLAPDHPFPAGINDSCNAVSHFIEILCKKNGTTAHPNSRDKVHIAGVSGGGNMAAVATMECYRKYPDCIGSSLLLVPQLNPACNTLSHYINSNSMWYLTTDSLRWCWNAYLDLPPCYDDANNYNNWIQWCKNNCVKTQRVVNPMLDLPKFNSSSSASNGKKVIKLLIHTNQIDPLHDDGYDLYKQIVEEKHQHQHHRNIDNAVEIHYIEDTGTHWMGTATDDKKFTNLVTTWKNKLLCLPSYY